MAANRTRAFRRGLSGKGFEALSYSVISRAGFPMICEAYAKLNIPAPMWRHDSPRSAYVEGRAVSFAFFALDMHAADAAAASTLHAELLERATEDFDFIDVARAFEVVLRKLQIPPLRHYAKFREDLYQYIEAGLSRDLIQTVADVYDTNKLFDDINVAELELIRLVDGAETEGFLQFVLALFCGVENREEQTAITATYKAGMYLLGILLATKPGARKITPSELLRLSSLISMIVNYYHLLPDWQRNFSAPYVGAVAAHFLLTAMNAPFVSVEQEMRICDELFISVSESLAGEFGGNFAAVNSGLRILLDYLESRGGKQGGIDPFIFTRNECEKLGSEAIAAVDALSAARNEGIFRHFAGQQNPAESRPIIHVSAGRYFLPTANPSWHALYERGLMAIAKDKAACEARDKYLEERVSQALSRMFGGENSWRGVCEEQDGTFEHDLVILRGRQLVVVESKAGGPPPAFRDYELARKSLQKFAVHEKSPFAGIKQGQRMIARLRRQGYLDLYRGRIKVVRIKAEDIDEAFAVCITLRDFGGLVVDWKLTKAVDTSFAYPWSSSIHSLEAIVDALAIKGWGAEEFLEYLRERIDCGDRLHTLDELDYAAVFIYNGSLRVLRSTSDQYRFVDSPPSDIFDAIEAARRSNQQITFPRSEREVLGE